MAEKFQWEKPETRKGKERPHIEPRGRDFQPREPRSNPQSEQGATESCQPRRHLSKEAWDSDPTSEYTLKILRIKSIFTSFGGRLSGAKVQESDSPMDPRLVRTEDEGFAGAYLGSRVRGRGSSDESDPT